MASRQGSIDQLCGLYSVLNATEVVIGKYSYQRKFSHVSQKRALFQELVAYLARKDLLEEALTLGIENLYARGGLIDIAIKSVRHHQGIKMKKQRAFNKDPETITEYWKKLTAHLRHEGTAVIICMSGRREHWTCVRKITAKELILSDSTGMRCIYRHQCSIDPEVRSVYTLWPSLTYLLSVEGNDGDYEDE